LFHSILIYHAHVDVHDPELKGKHNVQDYGFRMNDTRYGRFFTVDPFYKPTESPYSYAGDNPIYFIDFEGGFKMSPWFIKRYPTLAKILAYEVPKLINNTTVRDIWIRKMGMDKTKEGWDKGKKLWEEMLTWGNGPYVNPQRPSTEQSNLNNQPLGHFFSAVESDGGDYNERLYPDNILIGRQYANALEFSNYSNNDEFTFIIFNLLSQIFHEAGHWAHYQAFNNCNSTERIEDGAMAEEAFFGNRYTYRSENESNAQDYTLMRSDFKKNYYYIPKLNSRFYDFVIKNLPTPTGQKGDPTLKENGDDESAPPPRMPKPERMGEASNRNTEE
jgi:RHS repeat-associated protein